MMSLRLSKALWAAAILTGVAASASAQDGPRSVAWFITHPSDLQTMSACRAGSRTVAEVECQNARAASYWLVEASAKSKAHAREFSAASIHSPSYFTQFPIARAAVLRECANPSSQIGPTRSECRAAQMAENLR
jgi:hypothetical protein